MERGCGCGPSHAWLWKDPSPSSRKLKGGLPAPRLWAHKRRPRCLPFPHAATHTRPYYLFARGPTGVGHPTSSPFFSLSFMPYRTHVLSLICSYPGGKDRGMERESKWMGAVTVSCRRLKQMRPQMLLWPRRPRWAQHQTAGRKRHACLSRQRAPPQHKSRGTRPGAVQPVPLPPNRASASIAPNASASSYHGSPPAACLLAVPSLYSLLPLPWPMARHRLLAQLHWSDGRRHAVISISKANCASVPHFL